MHSATHTVVMRFLSMFSFAFIWVLNRASASSSEVHAAYSMHALARHTMHTSKRTKGSFMMQKMREKGLQKKDAISGTV